MIRYSQPPAPTETTTREHVEAVAATEGLALIPAGEWLYAIRKRSRTPTARPMMIRQTARWRAARTAWKARR